MYFERISQSLSFVLWRGRKSWSLWYWEHVDFLTFWPMLSYPYLSISSDSSSSSFLILNLSASQDSPKEFYSSPMDYPQFAKSVLLYSRLLLIGEIEMNIMQSSTEAHSVLSDYLWSHDMQHTRLPCPSTISGACSISCPSSQWCNPTMSSSVIHIYSCLQSFPASGSFSMVSSLCQVAKVLEFQFQYQSFQWIFRADFL